VLWDSVALGAATWPFVILFWPALPGSLATIFIAIRYWKRPTSLVPRMKWRFMVAILIALAELAFFGFIIFGVVLAVRSRPRLQ
jgi:hypothetical protein